MNASIRQIYLCYRIPSANDYMCYLQDATTVKLAIFYFISLATENEIITVVLLLHTYTHT